MKELLNNPEVTDHKLTQPKSFLRWSTIAASLIFSYSTHVMLKLYGIVHWQIMVLGEPHAGIKTMEHILSVLTTLMSLRIIFAALAVIFAGLSFIQAPKVLAVLTSIFAGLAAMTIFIMM